jgi:hypothetical protein
MGIPSSSSSDAIVVGECGRESILR